VTNHLSYGTAFDEVSKKLSRGMEYSRITLLFIHTYKNLINSKFLTPTTLTELEMLSTINTPLLPS
jgi:hypothetical protein